MRLPGEPLDECARRELREEVGLEVVPQATPCGSDEWAVYAAEAPVDAAVVIDEEHDRFEWVPLDDALARCRPQVVADGIACVASYDSGQPGEL